MTGKRNRKTIAVIMGLCLVLMIGGVYAYFSESSSMNNPFTTPNPSVEIVENFNPADQWLPGEEKRKEVTFNNSGNVESLMRFKVEVWMTDPEGKEVESIPENFYTLNWSNNFNNSPDWNKDFSEDALGYYYYNKVLQPGETTGMTLKSVEFTPDISNDSHGTDYSNYTLHVKVIGESIQTNAGAAADEWGMNVVIGEQGNVTWSEN